MITVKDQHAQETMRQGGILLSRIFENIGSLIEPSVSSLRVDEEIESLLKKANMIGVSKGFMGYKHVSCISFNEEVVHGIPSEHKVFKNGDMISVDVCASWKGYCVDMARTFYVGTPKKEAVKLVQAAQEALDMGIDQACTGNHLGDISAVIQKVIESAGYGVVRDFAGHGIGQKMHEEPEIPNFGKRGDGPMLKAGMTLAIEPMITEGDYRVCVGQDGWTAKTVDGSLAAHIEDTILITDAEPEILTRPSKEGAL